MHNCSKELPSDSLTLIGIVTGSNRTAGVPFVKLRPQFSEVTILRKNGSMSPARQSSQTAPVLQPSLRKTCGQEALKTLEAVDVQDANLAALDFILQQEFS